MTKRTRAKLANNRFLVENHRKRLALAGELVGDGFKDLSVRQLDPRCLVSNGQCNELNYDANPLGCGNETEREKATAQKHPNYQEAPPDSKSATVPAKTQ